MSPTPPAVATLSFLIALAVAASPASARSTSDTTVPRVSITAPASGSTVRGSITVSGGASDNVALSRVEVRVDSNPYSLAFGTSAWSIPLDTRASADGSHTITVRATDTSGNQAWASATVAVSNADTAAPRVSIGTPAPGATVSGRVTVSGTSSDNVAVATVEVRVDSGPYAQATGTSAWSYLLDSGAYTGGSHTITVRATDRAGNKAWASTDVTVAQDTTPPTVSIVQPLPDSTLSASVTVAGTAADDIRLARVELAVDAGPFAAVSGTSSWSSALETRSLGNGAHTIVVRATDGAGNVGAATVAVTVENAPAAPIYWGAWVGKQLTGTEAPWDMNAVTKFESMVGKGMSLIHFASPFANCASTCSYYAFPSATMTKIRSHGSIPFFSWSSASTPVSSTEPAFELRDVAGGAYDSHIRSFATAAHAWGHPFFLRFDWEMNGRWFPWGVLANTNTAADFVAAWRHVHDIFASAGATNATWVWCPNVEYSGSYAPLASLYPGDAYVDWTCLDGYNWGTNPWKKDVWKSFSTLIGPTYNLITGTIAPTKPMVIGETSSTEYGGSKAAWITDLLTTQLPALFPKIKAIVWMEKYDGNFDWPIESSASAQQAFAAGIQTPRYAANSFATITTSPIPAP